MNIAVPLKFGLVSRGKDNAKSPVCIHRTPFGPRKRFIGSLMEHHAGDFTLWRVRARISVTTLDDDPALAECAKSVVNEPHANLTRVSADFIAASVKAMIAEAEAARVHPMPGIGGPDLEAGTKSVRLHDGDPRSAKSKTEVVADILSSKLERRRILESCLHYC